MKTRVMMTQVMMLMVANVLAAADDPVGPRLQSLCVTIKANNAGGSGTIVVRAVEGKPIAWVLTAAHVVDGLRTVEDVISADGSPKKQITYRDAEILQEFRESGATVGGQHWLAKIINVDQRRDIALLRIRVTGKYTNSIAFYLDEEVPSSGTRLYHCASPAGETASLTNGIVAQVGRRMEAFGGSEAIYDQITCPALPGSSGGMVCLESNGLFVGMVTLGLRGTDNFHYMVPMRRIREWAEDIKVKWLLDPKEKVPTEEELRKIPLENMRPGFAQAAKPGGVPVVGTMESRP